MSKFHRSSFITSPSLVAASVVAISRQTRRVRSALAVACLCLAGWSFSLSCVYDLVDRPFDTEDRNALPATNHRSLSSSASLPEVEVVLSHYQENVQWVEEAREKHNHVKYTLYSKGPDPPSGALRLENLGREAHSYLHHIVKNYDNLADWTVFSQAAAPGYGFVNHNQESGHMCSGVTWDDYLQPYPNGDDFFMVYTVAMQLPQVWHSDRIDMMFQMPDSRGEPCPPDGANGWAGWWFSADHPLVAFPETEQGRHSLKVMEFYNKYIVADASSETFQSVTLNYANGARFAVARERILRRPLSYYKDLLRELSKHVSPIDGYYMEAFWYDCFHPERLQAEHGPVCTIPSPREGPTDHRTMLLIAMMRTFGAMKGVA